jgi:hypothetical protein
MKIVQFNTTGLPIDPLGEFKGFLMLNAQKLYTSKNLICPLVESLILKIIQYIEKIGIIVSPLKKGEVF